MDRPLTEWVAVALETAVRLAVEHDAVAVGLVGSQARGDARPDSDADIVVLTPQPRRLLTTDEWVPLFGHGSRMVGRRDFGAVQERRLLLPQGRVVELAIGVPAWASVRPVDHGTAEVVRGGLRVAYDPHELLTRLWADVSAM